MAESQNQRKFYSDITSLAKSNNRIAAALEEIAAQNRDPEIVVAGNLAAFRAEAERAAEIPTPPGTTRLHTDGDVCKVNRCTNPPIEGTDYCAFHRAGR